ncbi:MAG: DUF4350 domain-containing protein [Cyanobacteria bacterium J06639_1]
MKQIRRRWVWFAIAIAVAFVLMLLSSVSPNNPTVASGSTYTRQPAGYAAWFEYMQERGTPVQRWQRPPTELWPQDVQAKPPADDATDAASDPAEARSRDAEPRLLLQVMPTLGFQGLSRRERAWVEAGNTLVVLGQRASVSSAPFRSEIASDFGEIAIDTRRRLSLTIATEPELEATTLIGDEQGAIVWQRELGEGRIIYAVTPHLAANAYREEPGNFAFLADLVTRWEQPIWVDEYLHGHKDREVIEAEIGDSSSDYLAQTPLVLLFWQAAIAFIVLVGASNRRLGPPQAESPKVTDNSAAYMRALAQVLQKADRSEFVLSKVGKAERSRLQRALGLGSTPVGDRELIQAWTDHTGQPSSTVERVLDPVNQTQANEGDLAAWLRAVALLRQHLPD